MYDYVIICYEVSLYTYMYDYVRIRGGKFQAGPTGSGQSFGEGPWKVRKVLCKVPVGYRSRCSLESWEGSQ